VSVRFPPDLRAAAEAAGLNVSELCRQAVREALARRIAVRGYPRLSDLLGQARAQVDAEASLVILAWDPVAVQDVQTEIAGTWVVPPRDSTSGAGLALTARGAFVLVEPEPDPRSEGRRVAVLGHDLDAALTQVPEPLAEAARTVVTGRRVLDA
jgi:hypothetical protein